MRYLLGRLFLCATVGSLAGCGSHATVGTPGTSAGDAGAFVPTLFSQRRQPVQRNLPQNIIIIVQENRSVDNLFQGFPGADTQNYGLDLKGQKIPLKPIALGATWDPSHAHSAFVTEFNNGAMNGFYHEPCKGCPAGIAYSYVRHSDTTQYFALASQYALADHNLQPNEGPSFPGHMYLAGGQSGSGGKWYVSENPKTPKLSSPADCLAPAGTTVTQIDITSAYPGTEGNPIFPCIDFPSIIDELDAANISWHWYTPNRGLIWTTPYAIKHLFMNPKDKADVIVPETTILTDISGGTLPQVSWVIPRAKNSDHPGNNNNGGPAWVTSIVNALAASSYWSDTAVIVVWDDWGGWYDHYLSGTGHPTSNPTDPYEYGLRVPLLAIGAFAKTGYISHTTRNSDATLHFIEDVYGLSSLGKLDSQTDDLFEMFNFAGRAHKHVPIPTRGMTIQQLRMLPPDDTPVDSE